MVIGVLVGGFKCDLHTLHKYMHHAYVAFASRLYVHICIHRVCTTFASRFCRPTYMRHAHIEFASCLLPTIVKITSKL